MNDSSQLHAGRDTGPRKSSVPQPYPGCDVCSALLRHWIAATEPASPTACDVLAAQFAEEINEHRKTDERRAPAL
jgi:hypothetical protein